MKNISDMQFNEYQSVQQRIGLNGQNAENVTKIETFDKIHMLTMTLHIKLNVLHIHILGRTKKIVKESQKYIVKYVLSAL